MEFTSLLLKFASAVALGVCASACVPSAQSALPQDDEALMTTLTVPSIRTLAPTPTIMLTATQTPPSIPVRVMPDGAFADFDFSTQVWQQGLTPSSQLSAEDLSGGDTLGRGQVARILEQFRALAGESLRTGPVRGYLGPDSATTAFLIETANQDGLYWLNGRDNVGDTHYSWDPTDSAFDVAIDPYSLEYSPILLPDGVTTSSLMVGWIVDDTFNWPVLCYWDKRELFAFDPRAGTFVPTRPVRDGLVYQGMRSYKDGLVAELWVQPAGPYDGTISLGPTLERQLYTDLAKAAGFATTADLVDAFKRNGSISIAFPHPGEDFSISWSEPQDIQIDKLTVEIYNNKNEYLKLPPEQRAAFLPLHTVFVGMVYEEDRLVIRVAYGPYPGNPITDVGYGLGWAIHSVALKHTTTSWDELVNPRSGYGWAQGRTTIDLYRPPTIIQSLLDAHNER